MKGFDSEVERVFKGDRAKERDMKEKAMLFQIQTHKSNEQHMFQESHTEK